MNPTDPVNPPTGSDSAGPVVLGVLLTAALHAGAFALGAGLMNILPSNDQLMFLIIGLGGFGLVQLVWMLPAFFLARSRGRTGLAKGMLIGMALTAVLNVGCWGMVTYGG